MTEKYQISFCNCASEEARSNPDIPRILQTERIAYFNKQEGKAKGLRMPSAPDVYRATPTAYPRYNLVLDILREPHIGHFLTTSTRLLPDEEGNGARIIHNFGSKLVTPKEVYVKKVPRFAHIPYGAVRTSSTLGKAFEIDGTVEFLQALFDTNDSGFRIAANLENISSKNLDRIVLDTPQRRYRSYERAVAFYIKAGRFHINTVSV